MSSVDETAGIASDGVTHTEASGETGRTPGPSRDWKLAVGQTLAGRYRIEAILGAGGFGQVYRAHDELLSRHVALKVLHRDAALDEHERSAFLNEARTIARLDHPHIVPVYDAGVADGLAWMAMRLVDGRDLGAVLRKDGKLDRTRGLELLRQAASALEHAHRQGIVHRDIKPQNLLVEQRAGGEHLWLTDFGIAKQLTGATGSSVEPLAGTLAYMSPEQIGQRRVGTRSDLFSLGAVAYELCTGERAFARPTAAATLYAIVHEQPARLDELEALWGAGFLAAVRRALAKRPEDRCPSAQTFASELAEPARELAARTPPRRGWALWRRRRPEPWDGRHVLRIEGLSKAYTLRRSVLRDLELSVPAGAIYAILGRNSSGKSTLIRTFLGIYRADRGSVRIFGRDPYREAPAILARTGYVPESIAVYEWMRVRELLDFLRRFHPRRWDAKYCYSLLERFELPLEARIRDLSRGMKTKVSLVAALAHRPDFLVMDDPTLGLDAIVLQEFVDTIREASAREGTTAVLASHNLEELDRIATHAGFLEGGRMRVSLPLPELRRRMCEVRLTFRDDAPRLRGLEHFRSLQQAGRSLTGVVLDTDSDVLARLRALGPETLETRPLTLREIFVHLLQTGESAP